MQAKFLEWVVAQVLKQLDTAVAVKALVGLLRGAVAALKSVAAKTPAEIDDTVVNALAKIVEDIAAALKVA